MTPDTNKALIERYFAALRKDKNSAMDNFVAEEELKQHIAMYDASFPGYWLEAQEIIAERDLVSIRGLMHGVQRPSDESSTHGQTCDRAIFYHLSHRER